jgi:hypothetical protein
MRCAGSASLVLVFGFVLLLAPVQGLSNDQMPIPYPDIPRISAKQCLKLRREVPPPVIIDVRLTSQFMESLQKLPGAVHENPDNVQSWAHKYKKDQALILY